MGAQILNFKEQEYWLSAGFPRYYSDIVSVRLDLLLKAIFSGVLNAGGKRIYSNKGSCLSVRQGKINLLTENSFMMAVV